MNAFWKKTAILAAIGFILGILVGMGFLLIGGSGIYFEMNGANRTALYLALSGLLGAVNMGPMTIYSLERWGLLRCTLTHFFISMSSVCAVGFTLGWLSLRDPFTVWMLAGCVVVYFIIWLIMYLRGKRQVRRMNEALKRWKDEQGEK
ncbi:MAG: DUF3021 domain-containing protein [Pyramidobacter sp.]|nr:DUF3021 domain-containing protein [Pyramidobacter sp.]